MIRLPSTQSKITTFGAAVALMVLIGAALPSAWADVINGVSYLQPTIESTTSSTWPDGDYYSGGVGALVDGSGIVPATGLSDTPAQTDGFSVYGDGNIVFNLGANYLLTKSHIWSRTYGTLAQALPTPGFQSAAGGLRNFTISTSLSPATSGNAFTTPVDTFVVTDLPGANFALTFPMPTAGTDVPMATTSPARYVMIAYTGAKGWYTHRNAVESMAFNEIRFFLPGVSLDNIGHSSVTLTSAVANVDLLVTGQSDADVALYWGESDPGETLTGWGDTNNLGTTSTGLISNVSISNLTAETTYFYRFFATNTTAAAAGWSAAGTFSTPALDEWIGASDDLWGNAANWSSANVPDSGGESATFGGFGTGDVDLNGSSYTIGDLKLSAGDYSIVDTNASAGSLTVNALTNAAGANTVEVGMDVAGTAAVSGGRLTLASTADFDANLIALSGGTLSAEGAVTSVNGFIETIFNNPAGLDGQGNIEGYRTRALALGADDAQGILTGPIHYQDKNPDILNRAIALGAVGFDVGNSAMLWITDFVPSESGQWAFKLENIDDDTSFWVDTDGDGVFQIENRFYNRGCCGGTGEELTPALVAGQRYKLGFTFRDGGGGGYIRDLQFKSPSGSLTSIDPSDGAQAGLWNVRTADAVDLSSIPVSVLANSTLDANSGTNVAAFGALSLSNGAVLVTSGNALRFDSTTIADGATTAGLNTGVDTYASHSVGLDGNSAAVTIAKTGAADLVLDLPGVDLGSATFDVQAGSLVAVHSNAFGGATLSLNAGELLLSSPTGDITYVEAIAVVTNSTLTVGQAGDGVVGPLTNTISGDITFSGSDTLTTRATDDYTLRLGGQIVGSGTLDLTGGDVIIDDTSLNAIALNGGALTVFSNLTVNALSQNSGTFTMAGTSKDLTVANTLVLAGALDFTGANLLLDTATVTLNNGANITYDQNLPVDMITMNGNAILTLNNSALLPGTLTLNNGTLNHNDAGMVATNVTINGGTLNHLNHPFHADSLTFNGGTFNLGTNALNVGTLLARAGGTFNVTGPITGTTTLSFEPVRVVDNLLAGSADVLIGELLTSDGAVTFSATNTYTGKTQIDRGVLRADEGAGLPTNSLLEFSLLNSAQHGVLETSGTFARKIGSSAGQVRWEDHGGFAARGGPLTLSLTRNDDAVAPLAWTDPDNGFGSAILSFGSLSANSMVHLTNDIEMDQNSEIRVHNNADASITGDVFKVSGDIVESGGSQFLIKTGAGVLWLSGSNTWNGITYLRDGGTLRAVNGMGLSTNDSYLRFENGIFESWGTFARNIGAQADSGNVYWENQGGFAAFGGNLDVTLEQETFGPLDWGDANTGFRGQELYLGSQTATHVVDLKNDINLNGNRNLRAFDNINTDQDVGKISGIIANGSGTSQLRQLGNASIHAGTLWLTGTNTYTGNTWIDQGTIRAVDGVGLPTDSRLTFEVDNNGFPCSFESKGSFTRYTGTGSTNVHWQGQGGFAAWGGRLTVDLHGAGTSPELTWNLPAGGFNGQPLLMGSRTANDVVDMVDDIHLNGNRDIYVFDNPHSGSDVTVFSGNIRDNGNNNLQIYRDGVLKLNGTNTYRNLYINNTAKVYINGTHNSGGLLEVRNNQGGTIGGAGSITIGTFSVRDTDTLAPGDEGPGTLTTSVSAAEGLDMWNNSIYEWELGPAVSDTVNQTGNIRLGPGWTVKLVAAGGSPRADVEYDLFTYTGTATYGAPQFDTNSIPADWRTDTLTVVHDVAGKRVYLTGLYSVQSVANDEPTAVTPATATLNGFVSAQADPLYVSVFWGTNNGGMVAADWLEDGFTADLGSFNSVTSQPVSHGIAGLVSNELWYYTFYATNATGSVNLWAAPSIAFNAAGAPIVTNTGAGNFAAGTAWLSGLFLDHNRADVTLCWGTTDGGMTTPSAWQNTLNIGTPGTADFAGNATNVLFGAGQYVYRIYAASAYGTDWSDPATAFTQSVQPGVLAVTADLEAWYAASTLALSDGDPVVAWTDASTNARHLVTYQGTPNFKADVINGLPAVNFDNESLQMDVANPYLPMDVFLVFRSAYNTTFGPDWGAPIGVKDGPDADRMWMLQGNEDRFWDQELPGAVVRNGVAVSSANNFDMGNIDASEYMILKVTLGPNSGTQVRDVIVGSRTDAWPNSRFDTSEVLAYSSELSAADESLVGGYLASKYGINTPYPDSGALSTIANAAAAGVTHNSAWLNASLQAAGATFDVVAYWGPVDQSTNATLWANSAPVGTFDDGSFAPTFQATGLPELATTYFTFRATNLVQDLWAEDVASFVTDTSALGAQFSGSPLVGKSPLVVSFTDSSSGTNITSRFWD
ncbi:MAG: autotransporter-associated beta strand protein, partial [Kiritimatiellia bacterium]